jgi:hypothetical protein
MLIGAMVPSSELKVGIVHRSLGILGSDSATERSEKSALGHYRRECKTHYNTCITLTHFASPPTQNIRDDSIIEY